MGYISNYHLTRFSLAIRQKTFGFPQRIYPYKNKTTLFQVCEFIYGMSQK